jgi:hypothetical protein
MKYAIFDILASLALGWLLIRFWRWNSEKRDDRKQLKRIAQAASDRYHNELRAKWSDPSLTEEQAHDLMAQRWD